MRLRSTAITAGVLLLALLPGAPAHADPPVPAPTAEPWPTASDDPLAQEPRPGLDAFTYTALDGGVRTDEASAQGLAAAPDADAAEPDAQPVQVRFETPTGAPPERMQVNMQNQATGKVFYLRASADFTASGLVPPGEYTTLAYEQIMPKAEARGFASLTYHRITVGGAPVEWAVTMADMTRLEFGMDRPVVMHDAELRIQANIGDTPYGMAYTTIVEGEWDLYSEPTGDENALFAVRPNLVAPDGGDYDYHLVYHSGNGVPELSFDAPDHTLARISSRYATRGEPFAVMRNSYGRVAGGYDSAYVTSKIPMSAPGSRTEYYTADPAVEWFHQAEFGDPQQPVPDWFVRYGGFYEPGRTRVEWGGAPVGPGLVPDRYQYALNRSGDRITGITPLFSGPDGDEITWSKVGLTGTSVLTRDGVEVGRNTTRPEVQQFPLPAGDTGTYTLTVDASHEVSWSRLGTHGTAAWTFASAPTAERTLVDLSTVAVDAAGVKDGFAPRWIPQVVSLDVHRQGADTRTTELTMEVSYDEGATWRPVRLVRDGEHAIGLLVHPRGATSVSTRLSAVDDAGNMYTGTTIRSYGLR